MHPSSSFRPGFFKSLYSSLASTEFYSKISLISFWRSVSFLIFFSLLVAVFSFLSLWYLMDRIELSPERVLTIYDEVIPDFDAMYENNTLETIPEQFELYFGLNPDGELMVMDNDAEALPLHLNIDTTQDIPEIPLDGEFIPGLYAYKDGFSVVSAFGGRSFLYEEFEMNGSLVFTKGSLRALLQAAMPMIAEFSRNFLLITAPLMIFAYSVVSNVFLALLFSIFGILILLIMKKEIRYSFLIKLSFYATVPAVLVAILTALFGISVPFIPMFVYAGYYYYGLAVYKP